MEGYGSSLISGIRFSSVVPGKVTGDDKVHEPTSMDLIMKLHYIKGVYFFSPSDQIQSLTIYDLKKPMFHLLELYFVASGRMRRSLDDGGRPLVKCNDSGVRVVEAECETTIDEWLSMEDVNDSDLIFSQAIGPDLGFSPLVFIQVTRFKCGGLAVGLSWAHVLGDFLSASAFINLWGQLLNSHADPQIDPLVKPTPTIFGSSHSIHRAPYSVKSVDRVGDLWICSNDYKMATRSFRFTDEHLHRIMNAVGRNRATKFSHFEAISAVLWKSISKKRSDSDPGTGTGSELITICSTKCPNRDGEVPRNGMVLSAVEADVSVTEAEEGALAQLIREGGIDESGEIEELVEGEKGELDFIAYGARLTFVNLEEANIYGLELRGQKPIHANYEVGGVGDGGVVLVLPGPPNDDGIYGGGRVVTAILPKKQLADLKDDLKKQWGIV